MVDKANKNDRRRLEIADYRVMIYLVSIDSHIYIAQRKIESLINSANLIMVTAYSSALIAFFSGQVNCR